MADTRVDKSAVAGKGLFATRELNAGHSLGEFLADRISREAFLARRSQGAPSLLTFKDLDSAVVYLDGSPNGEPLCNLFYVNSVHRQGVLSNVALVCDGESILMRTTRAVATDEELLMDYAPAGAEEGYVPESFGRLAPKLACDDFVTAVERSIIGEGVGVPLPSAVWAWSDGVVGTNSEWRRLAGVLGLCKTLDTVSVLVNKPKFAKKEFTFLESLCPVDGARRLSYTGPVFPPVLNDALVSAAFSPSTDVSFWVIASRAPSNWSVELEPSLRGSLIIVKLGRLRFFAARVCMANVLKFGQNRELSIMDYLDVTRFDVQAGGVALIPPGCVWQMSNDAPDGVEVIALAYDYPAPVAGYSIAASLVWLLRRSGDGRVESARKHAAKALGASSPQKAYESLTKEHWGTVNAMQ